MKHDELKKKKCELQLESVQLNEWYPLLGTETRVFSCSLLALNTSQPYKLKRKDTEMKLREKTFFFLNFGNNDCRSWFQFFLVAFIGMYRNCSSFKRRIRFRYLPIDDVIAIGSGTKKEKKRREISIFNVTDIIRMI